MSWNEMLEFVLYSWPKPFGLICILLAGVIFLNWVRDLKFYKSNGWDFTKSSGVEMRQGSGDSANIPNRTRVLYSTPAFILAAVMAAFIALFVL